jgi:serine/threonine-protein kinase
VTSRTDWTRVEAALDELLELPEAERLVALARIAGSDAALRAELESLLAHASGEDALLDAPAVDAISGGTDAGSLQPGQRVGAYRIVGLLGRGGMGEVYHAERADGQFEQHVALKLMRQHLSQQPSRFRSERQMLARLDHPGIAHLVDGGIADDGRPYMVMELVDGLPIVEWCRTRKSDLATRLRLFMDICDAVAYAHRNLIVHRDLKPGNVLVTDDGRVKLLDFGIARLLDSPSGETTSELLLTPGYAAPEQLTGAPITTAADVHALGLLLFELLCGEPAFRVKQLPLGAAMHAVIADDAPPPSRVAAKEAEPPVPSDRIAGDLDAIVAKALRKEPAQRYASVDELRADIERHLHHEAVVARRGNRLYIAGRVLRRHRAWAIGGAVAALAIVVGTAATLWQAREARAEAARALAVKNFLVDVFEASDPRIPSDKPRGQITARELLDTSTSRIERDFAGQPDLQIELLGIIGTLYARLDESSRHDATIDLRRKLAAQMPGRYPRVEIEALSDRIDDALRAGQREQAKPLLDDLDRLIGSSGLDRSTLRAAWWAAKARSEAPADVAAQERDNEAAAALYREVAPHDPGYVQVLGQLSTVAYTRGQYEQALELSRATLDAAAHADQRMDGDMISTWGNIGTIDLQIGRIDDAVAAYEQAMLLTERTYGTTYPEYWQAASTYASVLHAFGHRDESMRRFDALRRLVPEVPVRDPEWSVVSDRAIRIAAQGEPERALPDLEAYERFLQAHPDAGAPFSLRRIRSFLGNAYAVAGRRDDARRVLGLAWDEYRTKEARSSQTRMIAAERWARVLVEDGHLDEASALFHEVLDADGGRNLAVTALAQLGLARVALARGDVPTAVRESNLAVERWNRLTGYRDVRNGPLILREQARALLAAGDATRAKAAAADALAQSLRYDAPTAPSIADARELVERASATR